MKLIGILFLEIFYEGNLGKIGDWGLKWGTPGCKLLFFVFCFIFGLILLVNGEKSVLYAISVSLIFYYSSTLNHLNQ